MFRIFCRSPYISSQEGLLLTPVASLTHLSSIVGGTGSGSDLVRHYSSGHSPWKPLSCAARRITDSQLAVVFSNPSSSCQGSLTAPKLFYEQVRNYWGNEGRPGWRRRRQMEQERRVKIMEPVTPLIDKRYPLPHDNMTLVPADLFEEEREELSPEETMEAQNEILKRINQQMDTGTDGRLFAVIQVNGKQFKVTPEDIVVVQGWFPPTVGEQIRLNKILLVGSKDFTLAGSPLLDLDMVRIEATVIENTLSYTKIVYKHKKRCNYRRHKFLKTPFNMLRINLIEMMQPLEMITSDSQKFSQQNKSYYSPVF